MVLGLRKAKRQGGFRESREIRTIKRPRTTLIPDLVMVLKSARDHCVIPDLLLVFWS